MSYRNIIATAAMLLISANSVKAQSTALAVVDSALNACATAAENEDDAAAKQFAAKGESAYDALIAG
ncbi:MAG TPA: hypothetical protein VGD49_12675, partial [Longimicrobiales bacterium]